MLSNDIIVEEFEKLLEVLNRIVYNMEKISKELEDIKKLKQHY